MVNKTIPEYFADATVNLSLSGGMVRIDFGSVQGDPANPQANPELVPCHRLIIPLNGFLKMFGDLNGMVQKLEQNGVLGRANPNQTPAGASPVQTTNPVANEYKLDSRGVPAGTAPQTKK
ncbi:MAG: hypothetical protein ACR2NY_06500 [Alphaproteobacteria bacterium]